MDAKNNAISNSVARLSDTGSSIKRKFTPNIGKALSKKTILESPKPSTSNNQHKGKYASGKDNKARGRINKKLLDDDTPRFVQSYSQFEKGIGCVDKVVSHSVEMHAVCSGVTKTSIRESLSEPKAEPMLESEPFTADIKQCFKYPPTFMADSKAKPEPSIDEETAPFESTTAFRPSSNFQRGTTTPTQLFDETSATGSLFTLRLPESLLGENSPIMTGGKFGKIQLLDNGESRLVISDSVFRLMCPRPTTYSSDVLLVEEEEENGIVSLKSLGHLDQCVMAVPDLDHFSDLGR